MGFHPLAWFALIPKCIRDHGFTFATFQIQIPCCSLNIRTTWTSSIPCPSSSQVSPPRGVWTRNLFEMWLFWENECLTLPAFLLVFWSPFDSVVDIGDVHLVDEGPAQLHPRVHHHLLAKAVPRHITQLKTLLKWCGQFLSSWPGWNFYLSAHFLVQWG